jgi:two-component system, cell cycle sensor histidine kinase and response regulator CckA
MKRRAQLFEPFFTTKPAGKGTGLGLATVYGMVKQGHSHIRVASASGQGAQFQLYFPLVEPPAPKSQQLSPAQTMAHASGGATILIAHGETALRQAVVEILRASGYKVLEARTAPHALEIAKQHLGELDVLLTDIVLPGLRGPETRSARNRASPGYPGYPHVGIRRRASRSRIPPNSAFSTEAISICNSVRTA